VISITVTPMRKHALYAPSSFSLCRPHNNTSYVCLAAHPRAAIFMLGLAYRLPVPCPCPPCYAQYPYYVYPEHCLSSSATPVSPHLPPVFPALFRPVLHVPLLHLRQTYCATAPSINYPHLHLERLLLHYRSSLSFFQLLGTIAFFSLLQRNAIPSVRPPNLHASCHSSFILS